jgi:hypothetical protein
MSRHRHPQTGETARRARDSLFGLLVGAVALSLALEFLLNCLPAPRPCTPAGWAGVGAMALVGLGLAYAMLVWDDRRVGQDETRIELLLPYVARDGGRRAEIGRRRSYGVSGEARDAWAAYLGAGRTLWQGTPAEGSPFPQAILPEHMALVRHLLVVYLARFGQRTLPRRRVHGFLRLDVPLARVPWEALPAPARDNPFAAATDKARPGSLSLPEGTSIEVYDRGEVLLRLRWRPPGGVTRRALYAALGMGRYTPGGEVVVRWLGPLSAVSERDRPYAHLTARLPALGEGERAWVIDTRLLVEVSGRWNALEAVARFRDWALNLAAYLDEHLDYERWRA